MKGEISIPFAIGLLGIAIVVAYTAYRLVSRAKFESLSALANPYLFISVYIGIVSGITWIDGLERVVPIAVISAGFLLSLLHPVVALSLFLACFLIRPWELNPSITTLTLLPKLLATTTILSWIIYRVRNHRFKIALNLPTVLFALLMLWFLASALLAFNQAISLDYYLDSLLPVIVLTLITLNSVTDWWGVRTIQGVTVISICTVIAIAIYTTLTSAEAVRLSGIGMWSNSNDLAALATLSVPFIFGAVDKHRSSVLVWALSILALLVIITGLYLAQSRGALIAIGLGAVVVFLIRREVSSKRLILLALGVLLSSALYLNIQRDSSDLSGSSAMRLNYLLTGFRMLKSAPFFGVGPGNYPILYEQFTLRFDEWGQRTAHSTWTLAMAEGGLPALVLLVGLYCAALRRSWSIRYLAPEIVLALVMYGFVFTFLSHTYLLPPYLVIALAVCASRYGIETRQFNGQRVFSSVINWRDDYGGYQRFGDKMGESINTL